MYYPVEFTSSEKNTVIVVKRKNFDKHNAFAYGYGYHEKRSRAYHKEERAKNKKICKKYEKSTMIY